MGDEKKKLSFGISKLKVSSTVTVKNSTVRSAFTNESSKSKSNSKRNFHGSSDEEDNDRDLITIIEDKTVKSVNQSKYEKKVPIVPLQASTYRTLEELEAIKALVGDAKRAAETKNDDRIINANLKIDANENENEKSKEVVSAENPDYDAMNIEDFGMACLRGMGWKDGEGIGKTNKQKIKMIDPETRPRGVGLGAYKKPKTNDDDKKNDAEKSLAYVKGACLKITSGKYEDKYGQLVSFDDGLNRIIVKLAETGETMSILQTFTQLVTKKEFDQRTT